MKVGYIKSPLNYVGGKYKLLSQILPLFPLKIDNFYELFTGGCNVGINIMANHKYCNDLNEHVIDFFKHIQILNGETAKEEILKIVDKYQLTKINQEGYLKCRDDFNANPSWQLFYTLLAYSFNNQIRFNQKNQFNMPFGKNRSSFNLTLQEKFVTFVDAINDAYTFTSEDFSKINLDQVTENDFVYCDPPYLITFATYNQEWTEEKEIQLLQLLDNLSAKHKKWALSNVLTHQGKTNILLQDWINEHLTEYTIHHLNTSYSNCNYHKKKDVSTVSDEVLICNYRNNGVAND